MFELGREVSAVLHVDELLRRIPRLIARLTSFTVFSVYMLDERRQELRIAYAEGYPLDLVKNRVLGALNLLSDRIGAFTERDEQILAQFGVHVAQALANAKMFEQERDHAAAHETLTEIAREVAAILDLDELLHRIAILAKRIVDYRTFGILLVNEEKQQFEPSHRKGTIALSNSVAQLLYADVRARSVESLE